MMNLRTGQPKLRKRLIRPLFIMCVAVILLFPLALSADTWRGLALEQAWRNAAWSFGPFHIQPSLVISDAGIDSNVYYAPADPVKDFRLTAGPAADIYIPIHRRLIFSASASPQYVFYGKTERERAWNHFYDGSVSLSLRKFFFSVEGRYSNAKQRWNTEIDSRPRRIEKGYGGLFLFQAARKTSFEVAYRTARFDYENVDIGDQGNINERLNHDESFVVVSAYHDASAQRRFFINLEYGWYDFENAETALVKDSKSYAGYTGFEFSPLGRRVRGRIRIGYKQFDILNPEGVDFKGIVGDTQVSVRVAKPFVLRGTYERNVEFSFYYDNPFYSRTRYGGGVSFYPVRFLRLDYNYTIGENRYPIAQEVAPGEDVERLDEYDLHSVGIYVQIKGNVALGLIGTRWVRDSNIDRQDDKRYFLGLNLTYDF